MQIVRGIHNIRKKHQNGVLTIGNFDGIHVGHQRLLRLLKDTAKHYCHAPVCVMTIDPPHRRDTVIYPLQDKFAIFASLGIDFVICQPFTEALRHINAHTFVQNVLIKTCAIQSLVIGDDFRFGFQRQGDYVLLEKYADKGCFKLHQIDTISDKTQRISSTRIKERFAQGDITGAINLLGRPYRLSSKVIKGRGIGRQLKVPTANLLLKCDLPLRGVYMVRIHRLEAIYFGVANIGIKPTLNKDQHLSLEVHIIGYNGNLYGQQIEIEFIKKIRNERKFSSIDTLKSAIFNDIAYVHHEVFGT